MSMAAGVLVETDEGPNVVRHAVLTDGFGVPLRDAHHWLPEGALPPVALEPEVDRVCDLCVDLARAVMCPDAEHDARCREVVNLPRDLLTVLPADRDALVVHEVAQALTHGNDERLLHGLRADDVVVDVREGDARGGARRHIHLHELLRRRVEEVARGDEECGAAVPHLVALAAVPKLSDWQEALREDRVRVGDVITPRLDKRDELEEPILARLHGAPSSRSSFSWIASSIQWCREGGTRLAPSR